MPKPRQHNEHFTTILANGRKSCMTCKVKFTPENPAQWTWFEYHNVRRYTVKRFCAVCFDAEVKQPLLQHVGPCKCMVNLVVHGYQPDWLCLD